MKLQNVLARTIRCLTAAGLLCAMTTTSMTSAFAGPEVRVGVIKVVCRLSTDAGLPQGTSLSFSASARASGLDASQTVRGAATVTKSANSQTVTLELPYKWTFTAPQASIPVSLDVSDYDGLSSADAITSVTIPMPANGATTTIAIPARL